MSEHTYKGIHDLKEDEYHRAAGVSKSMLDQLAWPKTAAHLRAYMDEPRKEPTDAMIFGSAVHAYLLQPDRTGVFAVRPEGLDLRTKTGKEWARANEDRIVITSDQNKAIQRMVSNVWAHPVAKRLLAGGEYERSLFAEDENGILRRGRLDVLTKAGSVLPDLKTCESAAADDFEKAVANYRYSVQGAYYLDLCALLGIEREHFFFICVEKTPPYCVAVYQLDPMVIEYGRKLYKRDLMIYRQCIETGVWPGYPTDVSIIGLPKWMQKELESL